MEEIEFSDEFCRFLQAAIPAVDAAELLLVFHSRPELAMRLDEAAAKLGPGISLLDAVKYLEKFLALGVLSRSNELYRYLPGAEGARHVDTLAAAYRERPVTLIRVIYALRDTSIKSFADAFRLRKN